MLLPLEKLCAAALIRQFAPGEKKQKSPSLDAGIPISA